MIKINLKTKHTLIPYEKQKYGHAMAITTTVLCWLQRYLREKGLGGMVEIQLTFKGGES